jgi:hypothetical protein
LYLLRFIIGILLSVVPSTLHSPGKFIRRHFLQVNSGHLFHPRAANSAVGASLSGGIGFQLASQKSL